MFLDVVWIALLAAGALVAAVVVFIWWRRRARRIRRQNLEGQVRILEDRIREYLAAPFALDLPAEGPAIPLQELENHAEGINIVGARDGEDGAEDVNVLPEGRDRQEQVNIVPPVEGDLLGEDGLSSVLVLRDPLEMARENSPIPDIFHDAVASPEPGDGPAAIIDPGQQELAPGPIPPPPGTKTM